MRALRSAAGFAPPRPRRRREATFTAMKFRLIHIALPLAIALTLGLWVAGKMRQTTAEQTRSATAPAGPSPIVGAGAGSAADMAASTPEARAYQSRLAFERQAREFVRDAPKLDPAVRLRRAQALSREIDRRERMRELSADEAVVLRVGLIHAAVQDEMERIRQSQEVIDRYRSDTHARQRAYQEQQNRDPRFRQYKAAESRIVAEVSRMGSFPDGMSREDYLRLRLQQAREAIYAAPAAPEPAADPIPVQTPPDP